MTFLNFPVTGVAVLIVCSCYCFSCSIFQTVFSQVSEQSGWSSAKSMPTARSEIAATNIGENIFVFGGLDKFGRALDTVEVYNVLNDSWKRLPPLPEPLHHTTASSNDGKLYIVGGFTSDAGKWIPTNKLFIYDTLKETWKEGRPMPTERGALTAAFVKGILYTIGGQQSSDTETSEILDTNEAYDPILDKWTTKKSMLTARHHSASAAIDGKIYVIGGRAVANSSMINLDINEVYDPTSDIWFSIQSMPSKRSGIAAASFNSTILVFGGEDAGGKDPKTYDNNESFNLALGVWTSERPLPTSRHGLTATSISDKIFVIGGGPNAGLSASDVNEVFNLNR